MKTRILIMTIVGIATSCFVLYLLSQMYTCLFPPIETRRPAYDLDICFEAWTRGYLPWN